MDLSIRTTSQASPDLVPWPIPALPPCADRSWQGKDHVTRSHGGSLSTLVMSPRFGQSPKMAS